MVAIFSIDENNHPKRMDMAAAELEGRDLQDLLEKNWDLLPGDLIAGTDNQPLRWAMIKREAPVESPLSGEARWSLDFLFADDQATPTFVECKLHKSSEGRREIIGQMFEYVANAQHYWNIDTLKSFVPLDFEKHISWVARLTNTLLKFSTILSVARFAWCSSWIRPRGN